MTTSNILSQLGSPGVSTGFKNRIINGAMVIDQRNAGASVTSGFAVDRWNSYFTQASKVTMQQNAGSVTPPSGFKNYYGVTVTTPYTVTSTDLFEIYQVVEGYNIADLGWGTANAQTVTLSFQVRSSLTGTFGGAINSGANNRSYPFSYTIPVANTWTSISVTLAGDTSGTWLSTNGVGLIVILSLGAGSTFNGTAGAWTAGNLSSVTGATSVVGTSGATFYITGVQLEVGTTATNFDFRSYGTELALCQRYAIVYNFAAGSLILAGGARSTSAADGALNFPIMRTSPTITLPTVGNSTFGQASFSTGSFGYPGLTGSFSLGTINPTNAQIKQTGDSGFTAGQISQFYSSNGCTITLSAEL